MPRGLDGLRTVARQ